CLADALAALEYYLEAARDHRGGLDHILDVAEHSLGLLGYWPLPAGREQPAELMQVDVPAVPDKSIVGTPVELSESVSVVSGQDLGRLFVGADDEPDDHGQNLDGLNLTDTEPTTPP